MAYNRNKKFTPEERAAYKEKNKSDIDEMMDKINTGVKEVYNSEEYKTALKFFSKFTDYSFNNTMLINMQKPEATLVAGYKAWEKLGRHVNKGETGIQILAPAPIKTNKYLEVEKPVIDEFGIQVKNDDGTDKTETVEKQLNMIAFKKAYVFDVSQTDGKELPQLGSDELIGELNTAEKEAIYTALQKVTGITFDFEDTNKDWKGYFSSEQNKIVIKSGMSDIQSIKTAIHESAHKLLHDPKADIDTNKATRGTKEVQAESVAFAVADKLGIDTAEYSFTYIAGWASGKKQSALNKNLEEIHSAVKQIVHAVDYEFMKMQKRDLSLEQKLSDTDLSIMQKVEFVIEDYSDKGITFDTDILGKIMDYADNATSIDSVVSLVANIKDMQLNNNIADIDKLFEKPSLEDLSTYQDIVEVNIDKSLISEMCK